MQVRCWGNESLRFRPGDGMKGAVSRGYVCSLRLPRLDIDAAPVL